MLTKKELRRLEELILEIVEREKEKGNWNWDWELDPELDIFDLPIGKEDLVNH